jgi:hypothetical protein
VVDGWAAARRRLEALPPLTVDAVIAVLCYVATVALPVKLARDGGWPLYVLAALASLPLVWRRRQPVVVAGLVGAGTLGLAVTGPLGGIPLAYGQLVATYTVASLAPPTTETAPVPRPVRRTDEPTSAVGEPRRMTTRTTPTAQTIGFLNAPDSTTEARQMFDEDTAELGYVMAATRLWAYQPAAMTGLFDLARQVTAGQTLTVRQRSILVTACASALGDSYCALVWGSRLAERSTPDTAAGVLRGVDDGLTAAERPWRRGHARWLAPRTAPPRRTSRGYVRPASATHRSSRSPRSWLSAWRSRR